MSCFGMRKVLTLILSVALALLSSVAIAQEKKPDQKPADKDDVVRVNVELVQTDVMVFDKDGRFVEGLKPDQFEFYVDGKLQPVAFFEEVVTGGSRERAAWKGSRGSKPAQPAPSSTASDTSERGRTILFFVNDLHLEPASLSITHKTIRYFIERFMGPNDQVAITSASGQIGFLQQFTNNRAVLSAALERLKFVPGRAKDGQRPPMSAFAAQKISEERDQQLFDYFV